MDYNFRTYGAAETFGKFALKCEFDCEPFTVKFGFNSKFERRRGWALDLAVIADLPAFSALLQKQRFPDFP